MNLSLFGTVNISFINIITKLIDYHINSNIKIIKNYSLHLIILV